MVTLDMAVALGMLVTCFVIVASLIMNLSLEYSST